jgi:hypothetical protein
VHLLQIKKNIAARLQGALLESILRQSLREKSYPVQKLLVVHLSPFSEVVRGGMCGSRSCVRDAEGARRAVRSAAEHGSEAHPGAARPRAARPQGRRAGARPNRLIS